MVVCVSINYWQTIMAAYFGPEMKEKQSESGCYLSTLKLKNLDCYIDKHAQL